VALLLHYYKTSLDCYRNNIGPAESIEVELDNDLPFTIGSYGHERNLLDSLPFLVSHQPFTFSDSNLSQVFYTYYDFFVLVSMLSMQQLDRSTQ